MLTYYLLDKFKKTLLLTILTLSLCLVSTTAYAAFGNLDEQAPREDTNSGGSLEERTNPTGSSSTRSLEERGPTAAEQEAAANAEATASAGEEMEDCGGDLECQARNRAREDSSSSAGAASAATSSPSVDSLVPSQFDLFGNSKRLEDDESVSFASGDLEQDIAPRFVKIIVSFSAIAAFLLFTYAGIRLILAQHNEEELKKAKDTLMWAVVGSVIIAASFAIILGVFQLFDSF